MSADPEDVEPAWKIAHIAVDRELNGDLKGAEGALLEALGRIRRQMPEDSR